jgi:hypothetical protein
MKFSANGNVVYTLDNYSVRAWNVSDSKMIASVGVTADSYAPTNDGSGFYYSVGAPGKIYRYDFATRTSTLVRTEIANYSSITHLAVSTDGTKIAYQSYYSLNGRYVATIVTLATGAVSRYSQPSGAMTNQIAFVASDTRVLLGGLRLISTTGTLIASRTTINTPYFTLSPDRTRAYARDDSGKLVALNTTTTLGLIWTVSGSTLDQRMQCSSDGNILIGSGADTFGVPALVSVQTSNGAQLGGAMPVGASYGISHFAVSPTTNLALVVNQDGGVHTERWAFDTATGNGVRGADFAEGGGGSTIQAFTYAGEAAFATEAVAFGNPEIRRASDGVRSSITLPGGAVINSTGTYYGWVGYRAGDSAYGAHIYRVSDGVRVASFLSNEVDGFGWGSPSQVWVHRNSSKTRIMSFTGGNTLTLVREFSGIVSGNHLLTPDGSRYVNQESSASNLFKVYDISTGALAGTIDTNQSVHSNVVSCFMVGNHLAVHQWRTYETDQYTNEVRFYDVAGSLAQVASASYTVSSVPDYGVAHASPDGSLVAFLTMGEAKADGRGTANIRIIRTADNALLTQYSDQFYDNNSFRTAGVSVDGSNLTYIMATNLMANFSLPAVLTGISATPATVVGGNSTSVVVTLSRPAPAGGTSVTLTGSAGLTVQASVTVPAGQTSVSVPVGTSGVDADTVSTVTATYDGLSKQAQITVTPPTALNISFNPASVDGGANSVGTVTLNGQAGPSGLAVALASSHGSVTFLANPMTVAAGQTSGTFTAKTTDPGATTTVTVTGTAGAATGSGTLEVKAASVTIAFDVATIKGGNALQLTLTLLQPAPTGGLTYSLSGTSALQPPTTVTIPAGATTLAVGVGTKPVLSDTTSTLTLTNGTGLTRTATATVRAPIFTSLVCPVTSVTGTMNIVALVVLDGPAPAGLSFAALSTTASAVIASTITVPEGQTYVAVPIAIKRRTTATSGTVKIGTRSFKLNIWPQP